MPHISQSFEDANMNKDIIEGKWEQLKGQAKAKWGDLTDDELAEAKGNAQFLAGKVQERYGKTKEEAEAEVNTWFQDNDKTD
jgi:uncharacterized protein YjbJ (UPF0337 family)